MRLREFRFLLLLERIRLPVLDVMIGLDQQLLGVLQLIDNLLRGTWGYRTACQQLGLQALDASEDNVFASN